VLKLNEYIIGIFDMQVNAISLSKYFLLFGLVLVHGTDATKGKGRG
jgi:hypothetical protein